MRRKIIIKGEDQDVEIPIKATLKTMQLYRTQFGSDLSKDLSAVYDTLNPDPWIDAMKRAGIKPGEMSQEEMSQKILENLDYSTIREEDPIPDEETQTKALQILWAMAKTANKALPEFGEWSEDLEEQPIRSIVKCIQEIWQEANKTTIEIKN